MKKFLTVLLVIAVMFTFSFGSAMAALPTGNATSVTLENVITKDKALDYAKAAYEDALSALAKEAKKQFQESTPASGSGGAATFDKDGYIEVAADASNKVKVSKAAYEKALANDPVYAAAEKAITSEYQRVVANINETAGQEIGGKLVFQGFEKEKTNDFADYPGYNTAGTAVTATAPAGKTLCVVPTTNQYKYQFSLEVKVVATTNEDAIDKTTLKVNAAIEESKMAKDAAYQAVGAITLDGVYSTEYKNNAKNDYELASELVNKALVALAQITTATDIATAKANIKLVNDIYTAPTGEAKAKGALYEGKSVTVPVPAGTGTPYDFAPGLDAITKIANQEYADADLAYAQNKVLNDVLGQISNNKDAIMAAYNAELRVQRDAKKPDTDLISDITRYMAEVEDAYKDTVAAFTYLVKYADKIADLGTYLSNGQFNPSITNWAYNASTTTFVSATPKKLLDDFRAAKITAITYKGNPSTNTFKVEDAETMADEIAKAEKAAANDKIYLKLDGSYAVQIDKALEKAIEKIYTTGASAALAYQRPTNTSELYDRQEELVMSENVTVNSRKYPGVNEWKKNADTTSNTTYEKDQYDEIRAIVAETKAAIKAAKTIADAEAAFVAGYEKMDAVPTAQEHKNAFTLKNGALTDKFDKYAANFDAYVDAKQKALTTLGTAKDYDFNVATLQNYFTAKWTGEFYKSIYTVEQLDAKYAEALAVVDNLKTKAELKTQYDAVLTALNALPAEATVADKDAVKAARKAYDEYDDYVKMIGASNIFKTDGTYSKAYSRLDNAEKAIARAERKAIADAFKALPAVEKITVADAPAVAAIRTMIDAYVADRVEKDAKNSEITTLYQQAIGGSANLDKFEKTKGYEEAVVKAYAEVAYDLISKLSVKPVDSAAVKAARAAYDAIPDYMFSEYVIEPYGVGVEAYDKLVALEKVVGEAVTSLKLNASSTAKKGSITVKWTVKGDASVAEGYQVWKSTKANKGYKKAITTKKTSYKNTKNLKKGKTYYYKVRAYATAADGTIMYSDWSNKAYRKAK